jgi:hypothetical protein
VRKILASLFVISAVLGIGVFTTGAYFTSSVSTTNQSFTTGTATLKFGQCGAIGANCSGVAATYSTVDTGPAGNQMTGPGKTNSGCLVIENTGDYDLTLKAAVSYTTSAPDFGSYFQLAANQANYMCNPTGTLLAWTPAATAQANSPSRSMGRSPRIRGCTSSSTTSGTARATRTPCRASGSI